MRRAPPPRGGAARSRSPVRPPVSSQAAYPYVPVPESTTGSDGPARGGDAAEGAVAAAPPAGLELRLGGEGVGCRTLAGAPGSTEWKPPVARGFHTVVPPVRRTVRNRRPCLPRCPHLDAVH